jgi:hypothetical protein
MAKIDQKNVDMVAATLAASIAGVATEGPHRDQAAQTVVDLYFDVRRKLVEATKRPGMQIPSEALERARQQRR